jgi:hypothetical protein
MASLGDQRQEMDRSTVGKRKYFSATYEIPRPLWNSEFSNLLALYRHWSLP